MGRFEKRRRRIEFPARRSLHLPPTSSLGSSLFSHCRPWFDALDPIRPPQGRNVRWTSKREREGAREQISPRSPSSRRQTSLRPAAPLIQALKSIERVLTPDLIDVVGLAALINGNNDHSQARGAGQSTGGCSSSGGEKVRRSFLL